VIGKDQNVFVNIPIKLTEVHKYRQLLKVPLIERTITFIYPFLVQAADPVGQQA